jgi:DNA-directed RNA polymerase II subunit RPB7
MFFLKSLKHQILLHPSFFGASIKQFVKQKLHEEVEGTCLGKFGFIIAIASVENIGRGKIQEGSGMAEYNVDYKAILFRPFKGEVMDAQVVTVNMVFLFF